MTIIVALPVDTGITKPSDETMATSLLLELQETVLSVVLFGRTIAVSCKEFPIYKVAEVWLSEMEFASCLTVTEQKALKLLPSTVVAEILTVPAATAVTTPLLLTLAIDVFADFHETVLIVALLG